MHFGVECLHLTAEVEGKRSSILQAPIGWNYVIDLVWSLNVCVEMIGVCGTSQLYTDKVTKKIAMVSFVVSARTEWE